MNHLAGLARAGLTHIHLLPAFDIASVNEDRSTWQTSDEEELRSYPPDSDQQSKAVSVITGTDGFNWGYDPLHYTTPEGSYATDPSGTARILEFREMVQSLADQGAIPMEHVETVARAAIGRENQGSTGFGKGVAVPHVKHECLKKMAATIGRSSHGVDFGCI